MGNSFSTGHRQVLGDITSPIRAHQQLLRQGHDANRPVPRLVCAPLHEVTCNVGCENDDQLIPTSISMAATLPKRVTEKRSS